jgi:hypothetical protein
MKLPKVHFQIIEDEVSNGIEGANFGRIMSAAAALKRFKEENRGTSILASSDDCVVEVRGTLRFVHKGEFFGEVVSRNGDQIFVKDLGKRKYQKMIAEFVENDVEVSEIPQGLTLAVTL